ncbi:alanine racemase [Cytobacillus spongiae]|uniref:alanine racemase n=1 Tax=Cytobacillus spongiae TaxID=2901381 RepID=UPI001F436DD3|nr:alanine racemase [Cytobacillus spongiae]UII56215.1 alanine racemase [Cytobacillus spongiae]
MENESLFYRDTWVEVDLDHVASNVMNMKQHLPSDVQLIAVVKANAYGHGDVQIARTALQNGAEYLAVAFMDEAIALRKKGIVAPILVLGASRPEDVHLAVKHHITLTVFHYDWLQKAQEYLADEATLDIHIKVDTGMGRIGIRTKEELNAIENQVLRDPRINMEGIFTHFATADELDHTYFEQQLSVFNELLSHLKTKPRLIHASNSAAALRFPIANFNAIRMGISMYGLTPSLEIESELPFQLQEAFTLHSRIIHVKKVHKGERVSYGATYEAEEDEWVGTLPIGYADGWIRKLQGQDVLVNGMRVPIVGRICMDQCMIKLPKGVDVGTVVTLIGEQGQGRITINEIARTLDTINYEIPCIISNRVPRIYKSSGQMVGMENSLLQN